MTQRFSYPSRDFDAWASAVRQQMLDSLARRRNPPQQTEDTASQLTSLDQTAHHEEK